MRVVMVPTARLGVRCEREGDQRDEDQ